LEDATVAARIVLLDREHKDLGALEDRGCAHVTEGAVASEDRVVVGGVAAAQPSEVARAEVVWAGVNAGGRSGLGELDGAECEP
jgi:hypothetical protein